MPKMVLMEGGVELHLKDFRREALRSSELLGNSFLVAENMQGKRIEIAVDKILFLIDMTEAEIEARAEDIRRLQALRQRKPHLIS